MKKLFFVISLVATLGAGIAHAQSAPIDLVVLVDTSESMLPYWKDTTDYIIKNILTGVLHKGDTFSLISFASRPELEISRKIESEKDIQAILARFLLLQPLGKYTDLVAAIQYLYQYVIDLPLATQKTIIILTDGIHDPPPDSQFPIKIGPNGKDISGNHQQVIDTAQAMRRHGWHVHIVQYPRAGSPAPGTVTPQPGVQLLGSGTGAAAPGTGGASQAGGVQGGGQAEGSQAGGQGAGAASRAGSGAGGASGGGQSGGVTGTRGSASSAGGRGAGSQPGAGSGGQGASPGGTNAGGASSTGAGGASGTNGSSTVGGGSTSSGAAAGSSGAAGSGSGAGETGLLKDLSNTLGVPIQQFDNGNKRNLANIATGSPALSFPADLGNIGYDASVPFNIRNFQNQPVLIQLSGILYNGKNILKHQVNQPVGAKKSATLNAPIRLPVSLAPGSHSIEVQLEFKDSLRVSPHTGRLAFTLKKGIIEAQGIGRYLLPVLFGIVLLAVVVLIVIFIRRIVGSIGTAPAASVAPVRFEATQAGIERIELRVSGQNPNIGGRNIHPVGAGSRRSVGGGSSAYLIYLYPCPAHIAEIVYDGQHYTFVPTKPEYFPRLSGELRDCLDRDIVVKPSDNHEVRIQFKRYVSPLDELNRIMHLIDKPGVPTDEAT